MGTMMAHTALAPIFWFSLFWTVACVVSLVMAGAFPLTTRPDIAGSPGNRLLVCGNAALLLLLVIAATWFGVRRLHWTSLVLSGGLIVLFAPALFHAWPSRWRDGLIGQVLVSGIVSAAMALLVAVNAADA